MTAISFEKARNNLKQVLNQVHENSETMTIVRKNGRNAVIMPEQEYNQLMEAMYLLQSPKNAERLLQSIRQLQQKSI
ncbi:MULTISPECIES: type II toxin-antitoxin system Phd/YefM family antitoxin [Exiguobacterium]|uniref:type II toxin-antitoxin system Phd/YefM family antitoxin n=1 Tax=Exiguobacterium TaxID=33986 RepID=UPI001BE96F7D|nr:MULTISPECIES: type II toxin-antitoxin system prevent-host-death family antitoxin [Exiguobacterium]MCT4783829.1 type II toxin-antitoxin system prevent-host-death family antitoxin [Exiguobacterium himgiriensis]